MLSKVSENMETMIDEMERGDVGAFDGSCQLEVEGKFFASGGQRVFLKAVTYGPFPLPEPDHRVELRRIRSAGMNAIRVYGEPNDEVLNAALEVGLWVMVGPSWDWGCDFLASGGEVFCRAKVDFSDALTRWGNHPAVVAVYVANEIPVDMVRWMGVVPVRKAIEQLIDLGKRQCPHLLFAYANFPTTEFLEPENADFTAMNIYLEKRDDFARYLPRLHHVAGDRPVLISEFGLDTHSLGVEKQKEVLLWMLKESLSAAMAGVTIYAWSDRWFNGGRLMSEWAFGLTDDRGEAKPALVALSDILPNIDSPEWAIDEGIVDWPSFSVVVCVYNGASRIRACLDALLAMDYPDYEVIVIDDGSTDQTVEMVNAYDAVKLITLDHAGLSVARNRGMDEARGEIIAYTDDDCQPDSAWLKWLAWSFMKGGWDACGGPNLPPTLRVRLGEHDCGDGRCVDAFSSDEAVVASAPGAPSHVMLNDVEAEHLPGCNLVIKSQVLRDLKGFKPVYRVAGDDVDLCWRLTKAGYRMGFSGGAFVWHRRRTTLWRYLKQQVGYGKAEALLMRDHPDKFTCSGGARWEGRVYGGSAMVSHSDSVIYHGVMGMAAYQQIALTVQPLRPLPLVFQSVSTRVKQMIVTALQPRVRSIARWWYSRDLRRSKPSKHEETWRSQRGEKRGWFTYRDDMRSYHVVEFRWWCSLGVSRKMILDELKKLGWSPKVADVDGGERSDEAHLEQLRFDQEWDMQKGGERLLVAAESHAEGVMILLRLKIRTERRKRCPKDIEKVMVSYEKKK